MDDPSVALVLALGVPLTGAAILAVPPVAARVRLVAATALAAVGLAALGVGWLFAARPVLGAAAGWHGLTLGPFDPGEPAAAGAWTIAPVLLGGLFVGIAAWRRSGIMAVLSVAGLGLAAMAAAAELPGRGGGVEVPAVQGALLLDPLAATLLIVTVGVGGLIVVYAVGYEPVHLRQHGLAARRDGPFLAWLLLFLASMQLLVLADDLRVLAVGWELTTLCSFALIRFDGDGRALVAADRALVYNVGGGVALALAALLAGPDARLSTILAAAGGSASTGAAAAPAIAWLPVVLAGAIAAAAVKSALVPFHPWLLGAMVAAAPVSALLHASTMVNAGSYLLFRLSPAIAADGWLGPVVALLGGIAFAWAAFLALRERDLKRILALSTVSTLGLIAASAGIGSPAALATGTLLLLFHAAAKALAFLTVGSVEQVAGTRDLEVLVGLVRQRPVLAGPLLVAGAALSLPPFGVAVAKWAVMELGARDLALTVLLAVGATTSVALWTAVTARLLVRRAEPSLLALDGPEPGTCRLSIAALAVASVGGMLFAGPVMALIADPAAAVAWGSSPGLAAGWSILLPSGGFGVPAVAGLLLAAVILGVVAARRIRTVAPSPYLSGATMGPRGTLAATFHGPRGQAVESRSGGFYWGAAALRDTAREPGAAASTAAGHCSASGLASAAGWAAMGLLAGAAAASLLFGSAGALP